MLRFLADENFNGKVLSGLLARNPRIDILRWQDVGPEGQSDPLLLEWAADRDRVLLTHDVETMVGFAYDRAKAGLAMPGVIAVAAKAPLRVVIEDLVLLVELSSQDDFEGQVVYVPL